MGKFFRGGAPKPNNKVNGGKTAEGTNENDISKANAKKAKKNKISGPLDIPKTKTEVKNNGISKPKKAKKNKIVETAAEKEIDTEVKAKKMKFVEMSNETTVSDLGKPKAKKSKKNKALETPADVMSNEMTVSNLGKNKAKKSKKNEELETPANVISNETTVSDLGKPKAKKSKKNKALETPAVLSENEEDGETVVKKAKKEVVEASGDADVKGITDDVIARYPILKDEEAIKKFQAVTLKNNQKGRIRQQLRQKLKGTSEAMLPDVINTQITALLKSDTPNLLKGRVLFNMLVTTLRGTKLHEKKEKQQPAKKEKKEKPQKENGVDKPETQDKPEQKVKGPKRYVVFIGNLALDITKEKILEHFSDLSDKIKDVRIPKPLENRKSMIAYLEVADEVTYELSLSKHHTMLDNKRINVLYCTQKDTKISKTEAKGKAAKLVAMQKSGQLAGSEPLGKKRSARRKKMKQAQKKAQEDAERGV